MKFTTNGENCNVIDWKVEIDEDGDAVLKANGTRILYIGSEDGELHRFYVHNLSSFGFKTDNNDDDDGFIKLY